MLTVLNSIEDLVIGDSSFVQVALQFISSSIESSMTVYMEMAMECNVSILLKVWL